MSDRILDADQVSELNSALRRANYNRDDIERLCDGNVFSDIRGLLHEQTPIIDCDADPLISADMMVSVQEHRKGGQFRWSAGNVDLYRLTSQDMHSILAELADKPLLNANVLNYLLDNKRLIPAEWRGVPVLFFGTTYWDRETCTRVYGLQWNGDEWEKVLGVLDLELRGKINVPILKS